MEMVKMPKRLIDVNYVDASLEFYAAAHSPVEGKKEKIIYDTLQACRKILGNAPTVDAVRVVRCKDCPSFKPYPKPVEDFDGFCIQRGFETDEKEFCSYPVNERNYKEEMDKEESE